MSQSLTVKSMCRLFKVNSLMCTSISFLCSVCWEDIVTQTFGSESVYWLCLLSKLVFLAVRVYLNVFFFTFFTIIVSSFLNMWTIFNAADKTFTFRNGRRQWQLTQKFKVKNLKTKTSKLLTAFCS